MANISDNEAKPGHVVQVTARQFDENGHVISETEAEWFGWTNADANTFNMAIVQGVYSVVDQFAKAKASDQGGKGL